MLVTIFCNNSFMASLRTYRKQSIPEGFYKLRHAAARYGVDEVEIRSLVSSGKIHCELFHGIIVVSDQEMRRWRAAEDWLQAAERLRGEAAQRTLLSRPPNHQGYQDPTYYA